MDGLKDWDLLRSEERTPEADARRVATISAEFERGFDALRDVGPCVTIFGSARFEEDNPYYGLARTTAAAFGEAGFAVMTGGGPGIMEAANRGAHETGTASIGCTIELPFEQAGNPYVDVEIPFHYFFARKVCLVRYSQAFILMPGGCGTLDELFETATLIQTGKTLGVPLVLMGTDFWQPITDFVSSSLVGGGTISPGDLDFFHATDDPAEAVAYVMSRLSG